MRKWLPSAESLAGELEAHSFTKLRLGKSLPGLRAAGPTRSTPALPAVGRGPGTLFLPRVPEPCSPAKAPAPDGSTQKL